MNTIRKYLKEDSVIVKIHIFFLYSRHTGLNGPSSTTENNSLVKSNKTSCNDKVEKSKRLKMK